MMANKGAKVSAGDRFGWCRLTRWLGGWRGLAAIGGVLLVLGLAQVIEYWCTSATTAANRALTERNRYLRDQYDALLVEHARLEQLLEMEQVRAAGLRRSIKSLQGELLNEREELLLYRNLVDDDLKAGLHVEQIAMFPDTEQPDGYRFRLVIARFEKSERVTRGEVLLHVVGHGEGGPLRLGLTELGGDIAGLPLALRHLQRLTGRLVFPMAFEPAQVELTIVPDEGETVVETYPWQQILGGWHEPNNS